MTREQPQETPGYGLVMDRRAKLTLTGVTDVESFDEGAVVLHTHGGRLVVTGRELHVSGLTLDSGRLELGGEISGLSWEGPSERRSLWRGLLHR